MVSISNSIVVAILIYLAYVYLGFTSAASVTMVILSYWLGSQRKSLSPEAIQITKLENQLNRKQKEVQLLKHSKSTLEKRIKNRNEVISLLQTAKATNNHVIEDSYTRQKLDKLKKKDELLKEKCISVENQLQLLKNASDEEMSSYDVEKLDSESDNSQHHSDLFSSYFHEDVTEDDAIFTVRNHSTFSVATADDRDDSYITGICELENGHILLADSNNMLIKLVNGLYEVFAVCKVPQPPLDVTCIGNNHSAIALDISKDRYPVYLVSVANSRLSASPMFEVDHCCRSIAYHKDHLYICSDTCVYMYTLDGILIKTVYENPSLSMRYFALSNDGSIVYITDCAKHVLVTVSGEKGDLHNVGLESPEGVCVSAKGHVFVCGSGAQNVVQVSRDGKTVLGSVWHHRDLQPRAVCFCNKSSTILVSSLWDENVHALTVEKI